MRWSHQSLGAAAALGFLLSPCLLAQGGPPFRTDDPETPGNRQWEINLGFIGDRNRFQGSYATPNVDVNYGLGDRIQLKYELPLSIQESRSDSGSVAAGLGNSLIGVKWRFFEHRPKTGLTGKSRFALSMYPQLVLNNPTGSVSRGIADPGPQFLLPLEANATFGPLRVVGEVGYWFTPSNVANSWTIGLMAGREFKNTELYLEFHDQGDVKGIIRETTLGIGGRQPIARRGAVLIMGMVGRGLRATTSTNGQPEWIAYLGLQFRLGSGKK